jgi:hypothetical protein
MAKTRIKTKSKCCKDDQRCKRCPAVWKKLSKQGYAERTGKLEYRMVGIVPKPVMKAARARG